MGDELLTWAEPAADRRANFPRPRQFPFGMTPRNFIDARLISSLDPASGQWLAILERVEQSLHGLSKASARWGRRLYRATANTSRKPNQTALPHNYQQKRLPNAPASLELP